MTLDDVVDDLLAHRCICGGAGIVFVLAQPVPCPDCGDV